MEKEWEKACAIISEHFAGGDTVDVQAILFLIGVNELGKGYRTFTKAEKMDIMHIATCKLLSYWGYYAYKGRDGEGWPQWELMKVIPSMTVPEEEALIKRSVIRYLGEEKGII